MRPLGSDSDRKVGTLPYYGLAGAGQALIVAGEFGERISCRVLAAASTRRVGEIRRGQSALSASPGDAVAGRDPSGRHGKLGKLGTLPLFEKVGTLPYYGVGGVR